jgi:Uma2 family endonuclease
MATPQTIKDIPVKSGRMTYERFLEETEGQHVEWIDGEVIDMPPISGEHQDLAGLLYSVMRAFAESKKLGMVRYEPFQMKTGPELPGRSPDICFIANENLRRLKRNYLDGPADIAVEVVSPDSGGRDRGEKFYEYEKGGVREYWLIDPIRKQAEFYQRGSGELYHPAETPNGVFRSEVLNGFWLRVDTLWQTPLPTTLEWLKELGVI